VKKIFILSVFLFAVIYSGNIIAQDLGALLDDDNVYSPVLFPDTQDQVVDKLIKNIFSHSTIHSSFPTHETFLAVTANISSVEITGYIQPTKIILRI
jgi:hypothetical protein